MFLRQLEAAGLPTLLGVILLIGSFTIGSIFLFFKIKYASWVYLFIACYVLYMICKKRRVEFLKSIFQKKEFIQIRLLENTVISIPFLLFLLLKQYWLESILLLGFSVLFAFFKFSKKAQIVTPTPFSKKPFEFTQGFRKSILLLIGIYTIAIISISFSNEKLGIATQILLSFIAMMYYSKLESPYFIWIHAQNSTEFLKKKILHGIFQFQLLSLPLLFLLIIGLPVFWHYFLLASIIGNAYFLINVVSKYSHYPNQIPITHTIILTSGYLFPPILLLLVPYYYRKSIRSLNHLLS